MAGSGMLFQDRELDAMAEALLLRLQALREQGAPAEVREDTRSAFFKIRAEQRDRRRVYYGGRLI